MKSSRLLLIIAVCFCSCKENSINLREKFGSNYDSLRSKLHLVMVKDRFKLIENGLYDKQLVFANVNEVDLKTPAYIRKLIITDSSKQKISLEEDYFKNPTLKEYLISSHFYYLDSTRIVIQRINDIVSQGNSIEINNSQADSIIKSWEIGINPFKN